MSNSECGFEGNSDLFGLGIRLGAYIGTFATVFGRKTAYSGYFLTSNISLFLAIWIIILRGSVRGDIMAIEIASMSILTIFQVLALTTVLPFLLNKATIIFVYFVYISLSALTTSYWLWLFWRGIDVLPRTKCPDEYLFFFAKVSMYNWFRTFSKVLAIITLVWIVWQLMRFRSTIEEITKTLDEGEEDSEMDDWIVDVGFLIYACMFTGLGAASLELSIRWNKISNVDKVDSFGQLIPLILAIGQLVDVIYRRATTDRNTRRKDRTAVTEGLPCPKSERENQSKDGIELVPVNV